MSIRLCATRQFEEIVGIGVELFGDGGIWKLILERPMKSQGRDLIACESRVATRPPNVLSRRCVFSTRYEKNEAFWIEKRLCLAITNTFTFNTVGNMPVIIQKLMPPSCSKLIVFLASFCSSSQIPTTPRGTKLFYMFKVNTTESFLNKIEQNLASYAGEESQRSVFIAQSRSAHC